METPQIRPAFVFINDTNPEDAKSKTKRKIVRSHAARGPHSTTSAPGDSPTQSDRLRSAAAWSKHQVRRRKREKASSTTIALSAASLDDLTPQTGTQDGLDPKQNPQAIDEESGHLNREGNESTSSQSGKSFFDQHDTTSSNSPTLESIPTMPGAGWVAPFVNDPGSRKPYIPLLIEHCKLPVPHFLLNHCSSTHIPSSTFPFAMTLSTRDSHPPFQTPEPKEKTPQSRKRILQPTLTSSHLHPLPTAKTPQTSPTSQPTSPNSTPAPPSSCATNGSPWSSPQPPPSTSSC